MEFPKDETGSVLAEMHAAGIDLKASHAVVYFQLFEEESQASAMAEHVKSLGIATNVNMHPDVTPKVWDVDITIEHVPSYDAVIENETKFAQIATEYSGYNDGWGIEA